MSVSTGKVYLIGAGPGDPGLITVRGRQRLAAAHIVIYDYLVNPQLLQHAAASAQLVCLGRHGHGRILSQDEINRKMIDAANAGQTVARLKGGDTALFARTAEEVAALEAARIAYEVVPGVSAVQAASSCTGIPLTHRDYASCVALVTGQQGQAGQADKLDMAALAQFPGTLVYFMGVTTASTWSADLIAAGKPPETPAAIVRRASLPSQEAIFCTLGELPATLVNRRVRPPAIIFVGPAINARAQVDWFAERPLFGRTIVVTRPVGQADEMTAALADLGAGVVVQPAIEIGSPDDLSTVDEAIANLGHFDWIVFSSANGVECFLDRIAATGHDLRVLANVQIAAIGPATVAALARYRLTADIQPAEYRAEALAQSLAASAAQKRFLLVRASRGRDVLAAMLTAAGAVVTQVVTYISCDVEHADPEVIDDLAAGKFDWMTVTSSAIARSLIRLFGDHLHRTKLVAISPLTAGVLADAGYPAAAVASVYTSDGVVSAILAAQKDV